MADSEGNSALFPIFVLTTIALPLIPYTLLRLFRAVSNKGANIHCECSVCNLSGKYQKSNLKKVTSCFTCHNLTVVLLWIFMVFLSSYIKHMKTEIQVFEPFSILGLEPGASESDIKKAYRNLSRQYHPDKNPDPEAHKYFVESISKAYQALTDPIARENFEKYGHPDGRQGFEIGIALPQFLLDLKGESGGILLICIVGVLIFLPLVMAVVYLSRSSRYAGSFVRRETISTYFKMMKASLTQRYCSVFWWVNCKCRLHFETLQRRGCVYCPGILQLQFSDKLEITSIRWTMALFYGQPKKLCYRAKTLGTRLSYRHPWRKVIDWFL